MKSLFLASLLTTSGTMQQSGTCEIYQELTVRSLGREMSQQEHEKWEPCPDEPGSKNSFIDYLLLREEFIKNVIFSLRMELLQGVTTDEIYQQLQDFDLIKFTQPGSRDFADHEFNRLYRMLHIKDDYISGNISLEEVYASFLDNYIYDQQNMGINNFIISSFQYALGRPPTRSEYSSSQNMITGKEDILFYQKGSSRKDYFEILTGNANFHEHQVKFWHYFFLFRYPDNEEVYRILRDIYYTEKGDVQMIDIIRYILANLVGV